MSTGEPRRVCLLTGAGGTLGDAFCRAYAAEYDIVAVCGRRAPSVPSQREWFVDPLDPGAALPDNEKSVYALHADLEKDGEVERIVDLALARFGRVDLLVNNAAIWDQRQQLLVDGEYALETFERHFTFNVGIPLRFATRLAQSFWRNRDLENREHNRNVVNVSSISGSKVYPRQAIYSSTKAALNQLTRHMAVEFESFGVRVNAIAPNGFPHIVSTESVAKSIARLDGSAANGKVYLLDAEPANAPA